MAEQRHGLRFRIPFWSTASGFRLTPHTQPSRPPAAPGQRRPFRPGGTAPTQPPPSQGETPQKSESRTPSPSRVSAESRTAQSRTAPGSSPFATSSRPTGKAKAPSSTPSPPNTQLTPGPESLPQKQSLPIKAQGKPSPETVSQKQTSPAKAQEKPNPEAVSQKQLPPTKARDKPSPETVPQKHSPPAGAQEKPIAETVSEKKPPATKAQEKPSPEQSLPRKVESTREIPRPLSPTPAPPLASTSKQEAKQPLSHSLAPETEPKAPVKGDVPISSPKVQTRADKTSQLEVAARKPSPVIVPLREGAPKSEKWGSIAGSGPKPPSEPGRKSEETDEKKKIVQAQKKEEKTTIRPSEEPLAEKIAEVFTPTAHADARSISTEEGQKHQEKHESFDREKKQSSFKGLDRSLHPKDGHIIYPTSRDDKAPIHKEIREEISKFVHKLPIGHASLTMDEKPVSVITVAGDNKGAMMHLQLGSATKDGSVHIHRGYNLNPDETSEATTDGEGSSWGRSFKDQKSGEENSAPTAYVNSNVQSINSSILFNSSVAERNPGVHLVLSHKPAEPIKSSSKPELREARKAEFNASRAEKHTYEPTIRRRCLRGLFLEPSDSDPDNPNKPRRHGCRYACGEKNKDKEMEIF